MANSYFKFKQFTIRHDQCAMKVGTDGVLLGAVAPVEGANQVLDIGTGTGLIALMLAQRSDAQITAIEIDEIAAQQALDNIRNSLWASRIELLQCDFTTYRPCKKFNLIVSNPPYFVNSLINPSKSRAQARHTDSLPFEQLLSGVAEILDQEGRFVVILPVEARSEFVSLASDNQLHLVEELCIRTRPGIEPKRVVLQFSFIYTDLVTNELLIELERHQYSDEYIALTREFYLKM